MSQFKNINFKNLLKQKKEKKTNQQSKEHGLNLMRKNKEGSNHKTKPI
jgi:hypothetical protein